MNADKLKALKALDHEDRVMTVAEDSSIFTELVTEVERMQSGLETIKQNADAFFRKWNERANGHPLLGFACDIELVATKALGLEQAPHGNHQGKKE